MKTKTSAKTDLSPLQRDDLLTALKARFEKNMGRHQNLGWIKVQARLAAKPDKLWSLAEMERTGGEPDVVEHDKKTGEIIFMDCPRKVRAVAQRLLAPRLQGVHQTGLSPVRRLGDFHPQACSMSGPLSGPGRNLSRG